MWPCEVHRVGGDRQPEALLDVLDQPALLPVGVLGAVECEQDVVGAEVRDGVCDRGQDAATEGGAVGVRVD